MRINYSNTRQATFIKTIFQSLGGVILVIVIPLLIGWWVATTLIPQPTVAVVTLDTDIWSRSAELVMMQLEEARQDPSIKAIVLQIDSPGGAVVPSQELYLELQNLRREMPVVASIDSIAASGGYYIALAADPIYAKPSSTVGNVGVWSVVPRKTEREELVIASGPFKVGTSTRDQLLHQIEGMKQEFLASIYTQRGDRMKILRDDLAQGMAYLGRDALSYGLIDHLGSQSDAVNTAAELAGIRNYEIVDLQHVVLKKIYGEETPAFFRPWDEEPWVGAPDPVTGKRKLPPGIYLLYDVQVGEAK
ncbi:MAG: S49 family peptidase [Ardenticatenaceae bacterium]